MAKTAKKDPKNLVFRNPHTKDKWQVLHDGRPVAKLLDSEKAAEGYLDLVQSGKVRPVYEGEEEEGPSAA